eukprot:CAMPEP_0114178074 /NCGR_PEP_ID=MMETSP0043_2-20121206/38355_1 /TAXON_ID=464988 /ORGANISM="Hemiselmis andersenii, Strain CCMP644" /LENGTH=59 /DNA_ID=CAMNT_0001276473 /DNA_START=8 /DNA_END=184 /DNA_ORIENTATION=-
MTLPDRGGESTPMTPSRAVNDGSVGKARLECAQREAREVVHALEALSDDMGEAMEGVRR